MKIQQLINKLNLNVLTNGTELEKDVIGGYCGDMLSRVMANASEKQAWVTINSGINMVAVAVMTGVSCVILAENVEISPEIIAKADEEGIIILSASKNAFEVCGELYKIMETEKP